MVNIIIPGINIVRLLNYIIKDKRGYHQIISPAGTKIYPIKSKIIVYKPHFNN